MSELAIRVRLDESGLDAQLKGVSKKFANAAKAFASIAVPIAAVAAIKNAIDSLAALGENAAKAIAPLHDTARLVGVNAERLQELRVVAQSVGVETSELDKSLETLTRNLGLAALGQGRLSKAFEAAGLNVRDGQGNIKSTEKVWNELTEAVHSGAITQEQATGLAARAFGDSGAAIVKVLQQTREEQDKVIANARRYGAIISNEVVASADEYDDQLTLIRQGTEALGRQTDLLLAPLALKWAEIKNSTALAAASILGVADAQRIQAERAIENTERMITSLRTQISTGATEETSFLMLLTGYTADTLQSELERDLEGALATLQKQRGELRKMMAAESGKAYADFLAGTQGGPAADNFDYGAMLDNLVEEFNAIDEANAQLRATAQAEVGTMLDNLVAEFEAMTAAEEALAEARKVESAAMIDSLVEEFEVIKRIDEERLAHEIEHQGLLTEARKQGAEARLKFEEHATSRQVAVVLNGLVSMTAGVAQHSKKMFQLNKLAAIGSAVMNTAQGVTQALASYPPPLSFAMAAAQAAAGAAQITAIKNTQFGGGGSGTTPSAAATPVVNDQPVGQSQQVITVRGVDPSQMFSGRQVVDLLNAAVKDGAKLVFQN